MEGIAEEVGELEEGDHMKLYMSKKALAEDLEFSRPTIDKITAGVQEQINMGRYPRTVIAGRRFNYLAIVDYMTYADGLKRFPDLVPEFDPVAIARLCGMEGGEKNICL